MEPFKYSLSPEQKRSVEMGKEGAPNKFMTFNEVTYPNQEDYESLFIDNYIQPNDTAFAKS